MTAASHDPFDVLCDGYLRQIDRYQHAIGTARALVTSFSEGRDPGPGLRKLDQTLNEIAEIDRQIEPFRSRYQPQASLSDSRMQQLTHRLADTVKRLIDQILAAEREAQRARERLTPELSQETRRHKMRMVYRKR